MVPSLTMTRFMPSRTMVASVCRRWRATRSRALGNSSARPDPTSALASSRNSPTNRAMPRRLLRRPLTGAAPPAPRRCPVQHQISDTAHQPVTRLVGRDVFLGELLDRLGDSGDQVGEAFHLPDGRIHHGVECAVHERGDELGKIQFVAQRPRGGRWTRWPLRASALRAIARRWIERLTSLRLGISRPNASARAREAVAPRPRGVGGAEAAAG